MILNMNCIGKKLNWWVFLIAAFLITSFSQYAVAGTTSKVGGTMVSGNNESADTIEFDGKGVLDSIDPYIIDPKAGTTNFAASLLVIIDGHGEQFTDDIKLHHYLGQDVTSDDLKPGIYVGFKRDPADKVRELWILKESPKKEPVAEQSVSTNTQRLYSDEKIINKDGVWKN